MGFFYDKFAGKGVLSELVYDLGGTGGVGKDIGTGCTNYTACIFAGVKFIVGIVGDPLCSLFLWSFSLKEFIYLHCLGSLLFSSMIG